MSKDVKTWDFEVPGKDVVVVLSLLDQKELDEFGYDFYAKGQAYNHIADTSERVKKEADTSEDYTGYAKRLESIIKEQTLLAMNLFNSISDFFRSRIVEVRGKIDIDIKTQEGWESFFDKRDVSTMNILMNMAQAYLKIHRPDKDVIKNSERVSAS